MNAIALLFGNLRRPPLTARFPDRPAAPAGYRGLVAIDTANCVGCGTCAYVCPSAAIAVAAHSAGAEWEYEPGRCTFCARCADACPTGALALGESPAPHYGEAGELGTTRHIEWPTCPRCGARTRLLGERPLARAFSEVTPALRERLRLCARCRRLRAIEEAASAWRGSAREGER